MKGFRETLSLAYTPTRRLMRFESEDTRQAAQNRVTAVSQDRKSRRGVDCSLALNRTPPDPNTGFTSFFTAFYTIGSFYFGAS